jgi:hypothetical protein
MNMKKSTFSRYTSLALFVGALLFLVALVACGGGGGSGGDGTSTTWSKPVINDLNGGVAGSGTVGSIFVIDGSGFGTPTSGTSGCSVNFRDATTNNVITNATVDLAISGNWTEVFIKATVPNQLTSGTTYKVTVTTPGGTSNAADFLVVASVNFSPSTILWSQSFSLPVAQQGFPTVVGSVGANICIYAIGGNTGTSGAVDGEKMNHETVYQNLINNTDGTLMNANWTALTPLPGKRGFAAAVFANHYNSMIDGNAIYVLGGLDDTGAAASTVYYALLNSDGTIPAAGSVGTWSTTTALPQPLCAQGAVIFHGRIYMVGGNGSTGAPVMKVYSAKINANGSLGSWSTLADLPVSLAFHQLVMIAGNLYVLGGDNAAINPLSNSLSSSVQDSIYYNPIDIVTGLIGSSWKSNTSRLTKAREKFSAVGAGSYILVSGGLYGGNPGSSEQSYSAVNSDGSLSSFNGATGSHTIANSSGYSFYNHSHCYVVDSAGNPHVLILGGADVDSGALHAEVWYQH